MCKGSTVESAVLLATSNQGVKSRCLDLYSLLLHYRQFRNPLHLPNLPYPSPSYYLSPASLQSHLPVQRAVSEDIPPHPL